MKLTYEVLYTNSEDHSIVRHCQVQAETWHEACTEAERKVLEVIQDPYIITIIAKSPYPH